MLRLSARIVLRAAAVVLMALLGSGSVFAQTRTTPRSYRSLFGGAASGDERVPSALSLTFAEAYDGNVLGEARVPLATAFQASGFFTEMTADVTYRTADTGRRVQFASSAGTNFRYYSQQDEVLGIGHYAGAGLVANLSNDTVLRVNQTITYIPSYLYKLFVDVASPELGEVHAATSYAVNDVASYSYVTNVALTQRIGPRNRLRFDVDGAYTDYQAGSPNSRELPLRDLLSYRAGLTFSRDLSRDLTFNVGYAYRRAQFYTGAFPTEHDVNIGFDYHRPLSKSRQTWIRVGTSSAVLQGNLGNFVNGVQPSYAVLGHVEATRQFARTWQLDGGYHRGVEYIEGTTTPLLSDGFSLAATGMLNPRLDVLMRAAYSVGQPVLFNVTRGYTMYTADARVRMALNRTWAAYAEYLYYYYDFSEGLVPLGAPPQLERNSVRMGLTLWVPLRHR